MKIKIRDAYMRITINQVFSTFFSYIYKNNIFYKHSRFIYCIFIIYYIFYEFFIFFDIDLFSRPRYKKFYTFNLIMKQ